MTKEPDKTGENRSDENRNEQGQFTPGNNANPEGRPKGSLSIVAILKKKLEEVPTKNNKEKKSYAEKIAQKLIETALSKFDVHSLRALQDVIDRVDGKPKQSVLLTDPDIDALLNELDDDYNEEELKELEEQAMEDEPPLQDKK